MPDSVKQRLKEKLEETSGAKSALRRVAIKLFGEKIGWELTKKFPLAIALFFVGFGIALGKE